MPIYLDYNASAPLCPPAAAVVTRLVSDTVGNASSIHRFGQAAKALIDTARDQVASLLHADPSEMVFTGGGTEANNLAIRGACALARTDRRHLVVSAIEHDAVLATVHALEREGWQVTRVAAGKDGRVDPDTLSAAITDTTALVALMLANNETGVIQPVEACARAAHDHGALFHADAVQAAGKITIDVRTLGVDSLAVSAHKFGGPQGTGALWVRRGMTLRPHTTGGRQERGRRAGTENVIGLAAMGAAAVCAAGNIGDSRIEHLRSHLESGILSTIAETYVNGTAPRVPNTTNISFSGVEGESLLIALDLEGIAVSTGSACASGSLAPSHVLRAMGLPPGRVQSALRFSLGSSTTEDDITTVLNLLPRLVAKLRRLSGRRC